MIKAERMKDSSVKTQYEDAIEASCGFNVV